MTGFLAAFVAVIVVLLAIAFRLGWMVPLALRSGFLPKGLRHWILDEHNGRTTR